MAFVIAVIFQFFSVIVVDRFVRDRRANYQQSMSVLQHAKRYKQSLITKTSIQLGHGETDEQVMKTLEGMQMTLGHFGTWNNWLVGDNVPLYTVSLVCMQ